MQHRCIIRAEQYCPLVWRGFFVSQAFRLGNLQSRLPYVFSDSEKTSMPWKVGDLQRVRIPPGQSVVRPEATRAMEEVTNLLKYSGKGHLG